MTRMSELSYPQFFNPAISELRTQGFGKRTNVPSHDRGFESDFPDLPDVPDLYLNIALWGPSKTTPQAYLWLFRPPPIKAIQKTSVIGWLAACPRPKLRSSLT